MFFQQLRDCDFSSRRDARLARVNVELEQRAHRIDCIIADRFVQRSLAFVVDRVLIDAVQRTQQLAHAFFIVHTCVMQRRPTFFCEYVMRQQTLLKNTHQKTDPRSFRSFPVAPQAISISIASECPREAASCIGCQLQNDTRRDWSEQYFENIHLQTDAYPERSSRKILAPF